MRRINVKKLASVFLSIAFAHSAYAVAPGFYLGVMAGPASNNATNKDLQIENSPFTTQASASSNQFGARLFLGYEINRYFGLEGGYSYFSNVKFSPLIKNIDTCGNASIATDTLDIVAKGIVPIGDAFDIYAKLGGVISYQSIPGAFYPTGTFECGKTNNDVSAKPTYGIGASYALDQNWVMDVSYNKVMVGGEVNSFNFAALGIAYHFVDKYCGQFLCDE